MAKFITNLSEAPIQFEAFFRYSSDLMGILDINGFYVKVNPALMSKLGYSEEELIGKQIFDFQHPDDLAASKICFNNFF